MGRDMEFLQSILFTEKMRHDDDSGITSTLTTKLSSLETAKDIVAYFNQILNIVDNEHNPLTQESMVVSIINYTQDLSILLKYNAFLQSVICSLNLRNIKWLKKAICAH